MNDLAVTILAETADDAQAIEHLHERTFGPGRFAKTAYRLRERTGHRPDLSFTARIGTLLVGSVWLTPVCIGEARALLLGPLTIEPPFRDRGIGLKLMQRLIDACEARGCRQMIAVIGDSANAGSIGLHTRCGFDMIGTHPNVGLKFGRWLDTVMMQLALGEGATTVPSGNA